MDIINNNGSDNETGLSLVVEQLLIEVKGVKEEDFNKWYEKKRKIFNTGVKSVPTKEEFVKYLNYALAVRF
jgi:hypothetical protein